MPPFGSGDFGPSLWPAFQILVARFWQLLDAGELVEAEAVLGQIFAMATGRAAMMAIYESCLTALEAALAAAVGTAEVVGGAVVLPEGGIILCVAIIAIYAIGGGSQPAYAEGASAAGGSASVQWRPKPVKRAEEFDRLEKLLFKKPYQAGGLVTAPKANYLSPKAQKAAASILLKTIKAFRGKISTK